MLLVQRGKLQLALQNQHFYHSVSISVSISCSSCLFWKTVHWWKWYLIPEHISCNTGAVLITAMWFYKYDLLSTMWPCSLCHVWSIFNCTAVAHWSLSLCDGFVFLCWYDCHLLLFGKWRHIWFWLKGKM